jgi:hypothetical protein
MELGGYPFLCLIIELRARSLCVSLRFSAEEDSATVLLLEVLEGVAP